MTSTLPLSEATESHPVSAPQEAVGAQFTPTSGFHLKAFGPNTVVLCVLFCFALLAVLAWNVIGILAPWRVIRAWLPRGDRRHDPSAPR